MSGVDLDFRQGLGTPSPAGLRLEFRPSTGPAPVVASGALRGLLGAPSLRARARHDLRVSRPTVARTGAQWRGARATAAGSTADWRNTLRTWRTVVDGWSAASPVPANIDSRMRALEPTRQDASVAWFIAQPIASRVREQPRPGDDSGRDDSAIERGVVLRQKRFSVNMVKRIDIGFGEPVYGMLPEQAFKA